MDGKKFLSLLHLRTLDDYGLQTVLCEVEAILNGQPLTKLSDEPTDLEPLTLSHILLMKGKPVLSPGLLNKDDVCVKMLRGDGDKSNILQICFGKDGCKSTGYHQLLQEQQK